MSHFKRKMSWRRCSRALAERGNLTIYLGDSLTAKWAESDLPVGGPGRPIVYPNAVISLGLALQQVYRLLLRQAIGLMRSVLKLAGVALPAPNPSTLCRRQQSLDRPA